MSSWVGFIGLVLNLTGAVVVALADSWFSRAVLLYLDALESDLSRAVQVLRSGGTEFTPTRIDVKRDSNQNRARSLKLFGWCILSFGFLLQIAAAKLAASAHAVRFDGGRAFVKMSDTFVVPSLYSISLR